MVRAAEPWNTLFARSENEKNLVVHELRVIYRGGHPLLALPNSKQSALACLSLYPAQTTRARVARQLLRLFIKAGWVLGMQTTRQELSCDDPFIGFLSEAAGVGRNTMPEFGILAGNPRSAGQRFLILVCDVDGRPTVVVKAGATREARLLVAAEASFLKQAGTRVPGVPALLNHFGNSQVEALALDYFPGESPRDTGPQKLSDFLGLWVDETTTFKVEESETWQQLKASGSASKLLARIEPNLRGKSIHPVHFHGDFAPWNIRVSPAGEWTVLDWERGHLRGLPGWDWFHFVIQPAVLVRKAGAGDLLKLVEEMLNSRSFRDYARKAAIEGLERELLMAYLAHLTNVVRPSEGLEQNLALLSRLARS